MPPLSAATFRRAFAGLDVASRTRFVAALYAARGWETTVEDGAVVAEGSGESRRIGVLSPGRFGRPSLDGFDAVVVARDRRRVREDAAAADVDYLTPSALRDLLLYGVDRAEVEPLFEAHFDRSLYAAPGDSADATGEPSPDRPTVTLSSSPLAVLVVAAVVLAGLGVAAQSLPAFGGDGAPAAGDPVTVTGTYAPGETGAIGGQGTATPESEASSYPPGVSEEGVTNASLLSAAHLQRTLNHQYALSVTYDGMAAAPTFGRWAKAEYDVVVEGKRAYRVDARLESAEDDWAEYEVFVNGVTDYRRFRDPNGTRTNVRPANAADGDVYAHFGANLVETFVGTANSSVECAVAGEPGDDCRSYRLRVESPPKALTDELNASHGDDWRIENYRATAVVTDAGFVTELAAIYDLWTPEDHGRVHLRLAYEDYGSARVLPPVWVSELQTGTERPGATEEGAAATTGSPTPVVVTVNATTESATTATETAASVGGRESATSRSAVGAG